MIISWCVMYSLAVLIRHSSVLFEIHMYVQSSLHVIV